MKSFKTLGFVLLMCLGFISADAHVDPNRQKSPKPKKEEPTVNYRMDCTPAERQTDMDINNVRAKLTTGGDVWWDLDEGKYVIPKPIPGDPEISSIFAGSVWIGGFDPAGNLKLAAGQYRNSANNDYYTGPLDPFEGTTELEVCEKWDRFFEVDGDEIRKVAKIFDGNDGFLPCDSVSGGVRYWPGKGNPYWLERFDFELPVTGQGLGSFWDEDQDGNYDPCKGDIPIIDIRGCEPSSRKQAVELVPDQMIFWIYNDAGGPHTQTFGDAIRMEVQVQAFAYATNDEINDMTFQRYKLINRAQQDIRDCYFAMWVDPDLGCYSDDYIGCDIERSMAYVYNEDILDGETGCSCPGGVATYCDEVPILGVDYFRGPLGPKFIIGCDAPGAQVHVIANADEEFDEDLYSVGDTICIRDVLLTDTLEPDILIELGMSSFVYSNNAGVGSPAAATTDPGIAEEFYNYLTGNWRDGTPFTEGGSGYNPGSTDLIPYAFPGRPNVDTEWSMCSSDQPFGDRRTIQASGPFLLQPGAVNELIIGAVWVPDIAYPCPDISRLQTADDLAQALFDNCFDITDGPDAPDVCPVELDQEVVLVLSNDEVQSNNAFLNYQEKDLLSPDGNGDSLYVFEGYLIYQLSDVQVSPQELDNIDKARLVRQVDVQNGISEIYNWYPELDPFTEERIWTFEREVEGADLGLRNTVRITNDEFASGNDTRLINHREYYYMALAYAHNNWQQWDPATETGQRSPYLEGRGNVKVYTVVPRPIVYTTIASDYGDGPVVTRLSGEGSGGNDLEVAEGTYDAILDGSLNGEVTYEKGRSPVDVIVYNPLEVQEASFLLELTGEAITGGCTLADGARWQMTNEQTGEVIASETSIDILNEQLIAEYGFSVMVAQTEDTGVNPENGVGAVSASLEYADNQSPAWYLGISDDGNSLNAEGFIRGFFNFMKTSGGETDNNLDPTADFSTLGDAYFYPLLLCDYLTPDLTQGVPYVSPGYIEHNGGAFLRSATGLGDMNNVDVVLTNDKSKWSRCVVVETAHVGYKQEGLNPEGNLGQFDLRFDDSVDKDGNPDGDGQGMGWFPGYAVDVETGKRLNIFFGENSAFNDDLQSAGESVYDAGSATGDDMIFNPSNQIAIELEDGQGLELSQWYLGGGHQIFVTRQEYDGCAEMRGDLEGPCNNFICFQKNNALSLVTWTSLMMTAPGQELLSLADGLIPNELTVKLRVDNNYNKEKVVDYGIANDCKTVGDLPKYRLDFRTLAAGDLAEEDYTGALESINIVPNPYYGYSQYESTQFENIVKITNLPANATVTIYSIDGKFIREFKRNENPGRKGGNNPGVINNQVFPDVEWDLENFAGIPVASGVYLFHVSAPDLGEERTLKWFGVHRQFDPTGL